MKLGSILIVGGGTAGWLTAGILAARYQHLLRRGELSLTLCESPNIPIIGVGEGTWPTMPQTLRKIGVSETEFFRCCDVSFKQGSKFVNWGSDTEQGFYYHPFDVPDGSQEGVTADYWVSQAQGESLAEMFSVQQDLGEAFKAPKNLQMPEYQAPANYGYHLNAGKFSQFLQRHCVDKLGVNHVLGDVEHVEVEAGHIQQVRLASGQTLAADLYIDCTGFSSLLLGAALQEPLHTIDDVLFADKAIAAQVPYATDSAPIASVTTGTAQAAGWIWDVNLPTRRGVGYVHSTRYCSSDEAVATLSQYIEASGGVVDTSTFREIPFQSGYRKQCWKGNCVAIGLAGGFVEPLEASALVMVELSAALIADQLPRTLASMPIVAERFNATYCFRWERVIEFIKLHYVLSQRSSPFWRDNRQPSTIPERLQQLLTLWQHQVPQGFDFSHRDELFGPASYQFVLYGSGFETQLGFAQSDNEVAFSNHVRETNQQRRRKMLYEMPTNRELLKKIQQFGMATR